MSPAEPVDTAALALSPGDVHADRGDWERAAAAVLRKARRLGPDDPDYAVWAALTQHTLDGIEISPLGTPALLEGLPEHPRPAHAGGRDLRVEVHTDDLARANAEALADLDGGATSLWVHVGADTDLPAVLDGVLLDLAPAVLDPQDDQSVDVAHAFLAHLGDAPPAAGTNLGAPAAAPDDALVEVARLALDAGTLAVTVDASRAHDSGASEAQELGWSLAQAVRVLRVLEGAGIDVADTAGLIEFRYAATDDQFLTIAKLRAARLLWQRVLTASEATDQPQRQHAVTSRPMMSKYDPWVNLLRSTIAAFAATVGGADAVTVQPFDRPLGRPDAFGRRIARNQLHLLLSESHIGAVTDPAGGAWAVERLTHDVATAAWSVFQRLESGESLAPMVEQTVTRRDQEIATRTRPITGLTEFPHLGETLPAREPDPRADDVRRYGAPFEALRDDPAEQPVFLATLGPIADHTARATFATNLFAAGGIRVEAAGPTAGVDDLITAYAAQPVVCLAGSDAAYSDWGADAVAALRGAGARHVIVAGRPAEGMRADDTCALGTDVLAFLTRTREVLR